MNDLSSPFSRGKPRVWRESEKLELLPRQWAAYRFVRTDKSVDYIGITSNLYQRVIHHRFAKTYYDGSHHAIHYQLALQGASWDQMREWEIRKIQQHSPGLVKYVGGNGRRPAVEVCGRTIEVAVGESVEDAIIRSGLFEKISEFMRSIFRD